MSISSHYSEINVQNLFDKIDNAHYHDMFDSSRSRLNDKDRLYIREVQQLAAKCGHAAYAASNSIKALKKENADLFLEKQELIQQTKDIQQKYNRIMDWLFVASLWVVAWYTSDSWQCALLGKRCDALSPNRFDNIAFGLISLGCFGLGVSGMIWMNRSR